MKTTTTTPLTTRREENLKNNKKIVEICSQPLTSLPTAKDLPRMAKKFTLFQNGSFSVTSDETTGEVDIIGSNCVQNDQQSSSSSTLPIAFPYAVDNNSSSHEVSSDSNRIMYDLMNTMYSLLPETSRNGKAFTEWSDYVGAYGVDTQASNYESINNWLLKEFGEDHLLVRIVKTVQQTIVIHALVLIKELLKQDSLQFKDVAGSWKVLVYFPSSDDVTDGDLLDYQGKVCICHRKREQVYNKFVNDSGKPTFQNLFQFEWELCIWLDTENCSIYDVYVKLRDTNLEVNQAVVHSKDFVSKRDSITAAYFKYNKLDYEQTIDSLKHLKLDIDPSAATSAADTSSEKALTKKNPRSPRWFFRSFGCVDVDESIVDAKPPKSPRH